MVKLIEINNLTHFRLQTDPTIDRPEKNKEYNQITPFTLGVCNNI
jgi:hypothetical protein